jgi:iron complex outermembrane recepter protein
MSYRAKLRLGFLSATMLTSVALSPRTFAQDAPDAADDQGNDIIVTATRRDTSLQDTPINITAVGTAKLQTQRIDDVRDIADFTPGITISDTGPRSTGTIVLRGLSAADTSADGGNDDNALGVYLGEVPLYYDFKLLDVQRVEILLGPQGTLYGLGTLAGAVRYIPFRPDTNAYSGEVHGRVFAKSHSDDFGYQVDGVINLPLIPDHVALRSATGYYFDPGFIDYPLLLQTPGVSLPQPGGSDGNFTQAAYAANLRLAKDVNFERTVTTRNQLLLQTSDDLKAILTYGYQQTKTEGRQTNGAGVLATGRYEAPSRYLEPANRHAHLGSLEINANLFDIADFVSTTAITRTLTRTAGDVTDLLLDLDYDYELFPQFSGFYKNRTKRKQFNQEVRFVSRHGGPVNWVLGGFYNKQRRRVDYAERTPGLTGFYGIPLSDNPEEIEYASFTQAKVTEKAVYGEATLNVTDAWQVTGGARYYKYSTSLFGAVVLPLIGDPLDPNSVTPSGGTAKKSGWVWKANTSYKFDEGLLVYATYSKGYRIGGPNRVAPCPSPIPSGVQVVCALPNELLFGPDTTKNLEVGVRFELFDRKLTGNVGVYRIKWDGLQLASSTLNGATGITVNGSSARNQGFDVNFEVRPLEGLTIEGTYAYVDAKLSADTSADLIQFRPVLNDYDARPKFTRVAGLDGDRLPGSAKNAASLGATYSYALADGHKLIGNWTATYRGNIYSRIGLRGFGEKVPSYTTHRASITYETDTYSVSLWSNNIFDKYAVTSIDQDLSRVGVNDGIAVRYYQRAVLNPRTVGLEGRFRF